MGFMSKNTVWSEVKEAGGSKMIPAGGYVARILAVEDVESKEYLRFTYDIAEGEHKGFFENDASRPYTHQFVRSYKDSAAGFMSKFLHCVEDSNANFSLSGWDNDPNDLISKIVGVIIQREDYTNGDGDDRARMNVEFFASADDIRNGRYKLPEPKDNREKKSDSANQQSATTADTSVYDADIPF